MQPHFEACGVHSGIIVEAGRDSHALNLWLLQLAHDYDYIGAVVAGCWVDNAKIAGWLDEYMESRYFVGVRTHPPGNPESWMQNKAVHHLLNQLMHRNLSLDLFVTHDMFSGVTQLAAHYSDLPIIINHCANPPFRDGDLAAWKANLEPLKTYPNIYIKYSSTLFDLYPKSPGRFIERLRPVTDFLLDCFGVARMLWGSNWPVEMRGGSYEELFHNMRSLASDLSQPEQALLYGGNAGRVYRIGAFPGDRKGNQ